MSDDACRTHLAESCKRWDSLILVILFPPLFFRLKGHLAELRKR